MCCVGRYVHMSAGAHGGQKRASNPPRARVTEGLRGSDVDAGNHTVSSIRAASVLNHCTIFSAPRSFLF